MKSRFLAQLGSEQKARSGKSRQAFASGGGWVEEDGGGALISYVYGIDELEPELERLQGMEDAICNLQPATCKSCDPASRISGIWVPSDIIGRLAKVGFVFLVTRGGEVNAGDI